MWRIVHAHKNLSVVVLIVHEHGIFTFKCKRQPPVAADIHRPVAFQIAVHRDAASSPVRLCPSRIWRYPAQQVAVSIYPHASAEFSPSTLFSSTTRHHSVGSSLSSCIVYIF